MRQQTPLTLVIAVALLATGCGTRVKSANAPKPSATADDPRQAGEDIDSDKPSEISPPKSNAESPNAGDKASLPATQDSKANPKPFPYPSTVLAPAWIKDRREEQLASLPSFNVFTDFLFTDRCPESGIDFEHQSVDYACKINIAAHYDHGNGIAVADVNGDGSLDVYLSTQIGANQLWINQGNGQFRNATTESLAMADKLGVSASFADTDNDGDPDLYVTTIRDGNYLFENSGDGQFTDVTEASGLLYSGHSSSGVFFDMDRDGLVDLFLCNVGVFTTDQRDGEGIYPPLKDAFAGHLKPTERSERSVLYRNLGGNRFADVSEEYGLIDTGWSGDASPIDANEDGWPDLYVLNMQGHDEYYENQGGKSFKRMSRERFRKTSWGAMGIQVFDFDNDGHQDIFITDMHSDMTTPVSVKDEKKKSTVTWPESFLKSDGNSIFGNSFFRNLGDGKFEEISDEVGAENYWPWGPSTGDLNADGFEDVFVASSMNYPFRYCVNTLLLNNQGKKLLDSEYILGVEPRRDGETAKPNFTLDPQGADKSHQLVERLEITEPVEVWGALGSRSSVIFDIDDDGDLDIMTNEFNARPLVLTSNLSEQKSINWSKIKLHGRRSNADGLGAVVKVLAGDLSLTKANHGQSGYLSQSVQPIYFGLGAVSQIDSIEVTWPSGTTQRVNGPIGSNHLINITEE